ncbi:MAG: SDR family oxidoreductase [Chloroflexi bacterium]|nr:SDR family oxidoreductase [Chloroflexota bacterium]
MGNRFDGKVAVVSGGGRGIGRAVALLLAEEKASVVVNDLGCDVDGTGSQTDPADEVVAEIKRAKGKAVASYEDVSLMEGGERVVQRAVDSFGRVDILVNSVGVRRDRMIFQMTPEDWDAVLRNGLKSYFTTTKYATILMRQQRSGRIVNLTSDAGLGAVGMSSYAAATEGVIGMTRSVARDVGRYGITCNAIVPGFFPTETTTASSMSLPRGDLIPVGRTGFPHEFGPVAVWLASSASDYMTGEMFIVDGGGLAGGMAPTGYGPITELA